MTTSDRIAVLLDHTYEHNKRACLGSGCGLRDLSEREHAQHVLYLLEQRACLQPTADDTPEHGYTWRDGLDQLDALLNDCAQYGEDYQNWVRVSAVRAIVKAVRRFEDDTDESIGQALYEDAIVKGEPWTERDG